MRTDADPPVMHLHGAAIMLGRVDAILTVAREDLSPLIGMSGDDGVAWDALTVVQEELLQLQRRAAAMRRRLEAMRRLCPESIGLAPIHDPSTCQHCIMSTRATEPEGHGVRRTA